MLANMWLDEWIFCFSLLTPAKQLTIFKNGHIVTPLLHYCALAESTINFLKSYKNVLEEFNT